MALLRFVVIPNSNKITISDNINSYLTIESNNVNNSQLEKVTIESVIDGDTIWVHDSTNNRIKVRFIGVNTPESVSPDNDKNCEQGSIASEFTKSQLVEDDTVFLQYDEELKDKYGRTLAYVWTSSDIDTNNINDIKQYMYNAKLLQEGYANTMFVGNNTLYKREFTQIKNTARINQIGFWTDAEALGWN